MIERGTKVMDWTLARRNSSMMPSAIREVMKLAEKPGVISLAGGFPAKESFDVEAVRASANNVLTRYGTKCLQYGPTEGVPELVDWICEDLARRGMRVSRSQVLVTSGSQQGLDLVSRVLIDSGSRIIVEAPTYVGALRTFACMEPELVSVDLHQCQRNGKDVRRMLKTQCSEGNLPRFIYVLPTYQNPTGRCMSVNQRLELSQAVEEFGVPLLEDDPYSDLWYEEPPPAPIASSNCGGAIYLGSFSKTVAPGLRLGYLVAPKGLVDKFVQAKQAADLHSSIFNQYLIADLLQTGFVEQHGMTRRDLYRRRRDALLLALASETKGDAHLTWEKPEGGMFVWARLREGLDATELLAVAVEEGVVFVPGAVFYSAAPDTRTLRLSFASAPVDQIEAGVKALARALRRFD